MRLTADTFRLSCTALRLSETTLLLSPTMESVVAKSTAPTRPLITIATRTRNPAYLSWKWESSRKFRTCRLCGPAGSEDVRVLVVMGASSEVLRKKLCGPRGYQANELVLGSS